MNLPDFPERKRIARSTVCIALVSLILLIYVIRLAEWQLIRGDEFKEQAHQSSANVAELSAARGQILDKNGVVLAGNRIRRDIIYDANEMVYEERNATIIRILALLEEQGEKWRDVLPIEIDAEGSYVFSENRESAIAALKSTFSLADYATAEECMKALIRQYNCSGFSLEDTRNVAAVRYSMTRDGFSPSNPYVIASGVSEDTVGIVSQKEKEFPGIKPRVSVERYYGDEGDLAPHVVGSVGSLSDTQYNAAVESGEAYDSTDNPSGYKWTDVRGQSGLENAFEDELRGERGFESTVTLGDSVSSDTLYPQAGNTVHTTLDANLQRAANFSLKENIEGNTLAAECTSGAAVAIDIETFGVLVSSSYPTFDMNLYATEDSYINDLLKDEGDPLFNRALEGTFTPGSTFKPLVSLAALQEGVISSGSSLYNCNGEFKYFDLTLQCTGHHGFANVYGALSGSCNAFFCQLGLNLGIATMSAYAEYFSLGEKTGVELYEVSGIMSNPQEYAENHPGYTWTDGLTAQTAIGQCDNMFSPIQLAAYCATIANGGVRLQTHFLDKVTDYFGDTVVRTHEPTVLSDAEISEDVLNVVREGMLQVVSDRINGTAYSTFGNYPVAVAAKTGTAETSSNEESEPNLTFIAYAPAYDPEIAVAVVMEKGYKGAYAQRVAKDIFDCYFGYTSWDEEGNRYDSEGNIIDGDGNILKTREEVEAEKQNNEAAADEPSEPSPSASPDTSPDVSAGRGDVIPDEPFTGEASPAPSPSADAESEDEDGDENDEGEGEEENSEPDAPFWGG